MKRFQTVLGYTIAIFMLPLVFAMFIGEDFWKKKLVETTGLVVSPWYTGGPIERILPMKDYQIEIHHPVVNGVFGPRREGFIQIGWRSCDSLPRFINDPVDLDNDQRTDLWVRGDTTGEKAVIKAVNPNVLGLRGVYKLKDSWAVRVSIRNKRR